MRHFGILFCAAAVIAAVACNKVEQEIEIPVDEPVLRPMTFTATTTNTRTTLDGTSVNWSTSDVISVFDGQGNQPFTSAGSGKTVDFNGNADPNAGVYYALYPYSPTASFSGTTVTTTLSANQTPMLGSFAEGLNINAAKSSTTDFVFNNVLSVAKFTITAENLGGKTIKTVKFASTYPLAGDVVIDYSGEIATATAGTSTINEITMTASDGFENGDYYFVVLPNEGGTITMTFESTDGYVARVSASLGKAFSAGVIKNLGTVNGLNWVLSYSIVFGNNANSNTGLSSSTQKATVISTGTEYVTNTPFTIQSGNAYYGDNKSSIRMGKSGNSATLKIALSNSGTVCAKKVIVNCAQFNASNAGSLSVNGATAQNVPASAGDLSFSFSGDMISELVLSVTKATFIYAITVDYVIKTPVTLSFGDITTFNVTQGGSFTPPTLTTNPAGLTVTYASSKEEVATVDANTGAVTLMGGLGATTITATFAGDVTYSSGFAEYTLVVSRAAYTSIAQLKEDLGTSTSSIDFTANLTNAIVTRTYDNYLAWIQDETAGMFVANGSNLTQGDSYTGTITGSMKVSSNHQPQFVSIDVSQATKTTGASRTPEVVTIADLTDNMASYDGKLCKIRKAKADGNLVTGENKSISISQGENSMTFFTRASFASGSISANNYYDIIGMPTRYNDSYEIVVVSTNDVTAASVTWILSSIEVKTPPSKTHYTINECFDPAGLVLSTLEVDSELSYITRAGADVAYSASAEGFSFSPSLDTPLEESNTSVTITYNNKVATQTIEVSDGSIQPNTVLFSETWGTTASSIANYDGSGASSYNNASTITYATTSTNAKVDATSGIANCSSAHLYINGKDKGTGFTVTISGIRSYGATKVRVTWACNNTGTTVGIVESSSADVKSANSESNSADFVLTGAEETISLKIYNNSKANTRSDNYQVIFIE